MIVQGKQGTTLLNRIDIEKIDSFDDFRRAGDIIKWIDSQLKAGKFLKTRGREVLVNVPGGKSLNIINIPSKEDYIEYIKSWLKVYNLSLDYLEGSLNAACLENIFIKREGNDWTIPVFENGTVERRIIEWPLFYTQNANYAIVLDNILDRYNELKQSYLLSVRKKEDGIVVKKSSVVLDNKVQVNVSKQVSHPVQNIITENKLNNVQDGSIPQQSNKMQSFDNSIQEAIAVEMEKDNSAIENDFQDLIIQKISDGAVIDNRDIEILKNQKTDLVLLTCQDINNSKEEDIFLKNAVKCQADNFNVGAFIYGKANDEHMGAIEIKRIMKDLEKFDDRFSGLVVYSIDNNYVQKNRNSEIKLLDFMNMYNAIVSTLKQAGYNVMLSMNLKSGQIIEELNRKYNMQNEHEVIYMAVVRDASEISNNTSSIIVDPGNDYDIVTIKNRELLNQIEEKIGKKRLAKVA